jgi:hypothetical protein
MLPPATPARANARQRHRGADPGQHRRSRFLAAGFRPAQPPLLPLALLFMVLIAIMCTAIGAAIGSVLQDMQGFQLTISFLVLPLFFFSSALFPVPDLPGAMRLEDIELPLGEEFRGNTITQRDAQVAPAHAGCSPAESGGGGRRFRPSPQPTLGPCFRLN